MVAAERRVYISPSPFFFIVNRSLFRNGMSPLLGYSSFVPQKALIWHTARQEGGTISEEEKRREAAGTWDGAKREEKAVNHRMGQRKRRRKDFPLLAVWSTVFCRPVHFLLFLLFLSDLFCCFGRIPWDSYDIVSNLKKRQAAEEIKKFLASEQWLGSSYLPPFYRHLSLLTV